MAGWNLEGIDLGRRALIGVVFVNCELSLASFSGADLSTARFVDCNLYGVDFRGAMLYTTWFYECNLTKASFEGSYLLGFRLRNADITKTSFDAEPLVGAERKSRALVTGRVLSVPLLGRLPADVATVERDYDGIAMTGNPHPVAFLRTSGDGRYRVRIRTAETAKYLRAVHAQNGYESLADHYYVVERRQRRRALHGSFLQLARRAYDYLLGDVLWRYGSKPSRPIAALFLLALTASVTTYVAPSLDPGAGLRPSSDAPLYGYQGFTAESAVEYLNVLYFFLTSTVGGSQAELSGWTKAVFVGYVLSAVWLIALVFESSARRLGRSE